MNKKKCKAFPFPQILPNSAPKKTAQDGTNFRLGLPYIPNLKELSCEKRAPSAPGAGIPDDKWNFEGKTVGID